MLQSFGFPLQIDGYSEAEDVVLAQKAFDQVGRVDSFYVGHSAALLRFLTCRLSREKGRFQIFGQARLFERPHTELKTALEQLDVDVQFARDHILIEGRGWDQPMGAVELDLSRSSQFASGLILAAWNLPFPLVLQLSESRVSEGYWQMSVRMASRLGMKIENEGTRYLIPPHQIVKVPHITIEPDMSSAFAIAALAAIAGEAKILDFPDYSWQPDFAFVEILRDMGVEIAHARGTLTVKKKELRPIQRRLTSTPDLFPVLAVLCAFAEGKTQLHGAPHLAFKESNRLKRVAEFIQSLGRSIELLPDGMILHGRPVSESEALSQTPITLLSDQDHRLVMAGMVARWAGLSINIQSPEVVNKSFPEYLHLSEPT